MRRLFAVYILVGIAVSFFVGWKLHDPISDMLHPHVASPDYLFRVSFMNKFPPKGEVAFVGDSHIARADWNSLLNRSDIANYGVGGDGTTSLLKRLEPVINSGAKRAVLMIGVNDLFQGKTPEETAQNIFKIISALQKKMAVTVLSVMPTTGQFGDVNHKIAILDQKISALCVAACSFVDLRNVIGGTELKPEYSLEGLHLNTQGYIAISEPIAKAITQQH